MNQLLVKSLRHQKLIGHNGYYQLWFNFQSILLGCLVFRGRKAFAYNMLLDIRLFVKQLENFDPFFVFLISILRMRPNIFISKKRKSGVINEIPFPITDHKQLSLAMRWLIKSIKSSQKSLQSDRIADVIVSSVYKEGAVLRKRNEVHRTALSNKALVRFLK